MDIHIVLNQNTSSRIVGGYICLFFFSDVRVLRYWSYTWIKYCVEYVLLYVVPKNAYNSLYFHTITRPSSLAVAKKFCVRLTSTPRTQSICPCKVNWQTPLSVSHTRTLWSWEPDTIHRVSSSWNNATE